MPYKLNDQQKTQLLANLSRRICGELVVVTDLPTIEKLMDILEIPDYVVVQVMTSPIAFFERDGNRFPMEALSRKLRMDWDIPVEESWKKDIEYELEADWKYKGDGITKILWAPYWMPHTSNPIYDPKDFTINRSWRIRYAKRAF
jgi:hypothetical protein